MTRNMVNSRGVMQSYRLYILDSLGDHIDDCVELRAHDDAAAVAAAVQLTGRRPSELWRLDRRIRNFNATAPLLAA
jgi:hypothetical protein